MYQHNYLKLSSERRHVRLSCIMTVISNCLQNKDMSGNNVSRVISNCLQKEDMYVSTQLSQIVFRKKICYPGYFIAVVYQHSYLKMSSERRHVCINTVLSNCHQKEDMYVSTQFSQIAIRKKTCMYQHSSLKLPSERRHVCVDSSLKLPSERRHVCINTILLNCHQKEDMYVSTQFSQIAIRKKTCQAVHPSHPVLMFLPVYFSLLFACRTSLSAMALVLLGNNNATTSVGQCP